MAVTAPGWLALCVAGTSGSHWFQHVRDCPWTHTLALAWTCATVGCSPQPQLRNTTYWMLEGLSVSNSMENCSVLDSSCDDVGTSVPVVPVVSRTPVKPGGVTSRVRTPCSAAETPEPAWM